MQKAKKYYVDEKGNMIGYIRYKNKNELTEKPAFSFSGKLKIIDFGLLNYGFYLIVQDENGSLYSMNDIQFAKCLKENKNDIFIDGDWAFFQQGTAFSIGLNK